jgi:hypothetical protein
MNLLLIVLAAPVMWAASSPNHIDQCDVATLLFTALVGLIVLSKNLSGLRILRSALVHKLSAISCMVVGPGITAAW